MGGNFEHAVIALMTPKYTFLARELIKAIKVRSSDSTLILYCLEVLDRILVPMFHKYSNLSTVLDLKFTLEYMPRISQKCTEASVTST